MILDHKHLIIRAEVFNSPKEVDKIEIWLKKLVKNIRMQLIQGIGDNPVAFYCDVVGNRGLTAVAIIETSHIALHSWDEVNPGIIQLDVYSCSDFSPEEVIEHLHEFTPLKVEYKFLDRNAGLVQVI